MLLVLIVCTFGMSAGLDLHVYKGQDLRYDVHSYLVLLDIYRDTKFFCSGSIISSSWIITAAHCVVENFSKLVVSHGGGEKKQQLAVVFKFDTKIHPKYNKDNLTVEYLSRDVALIYLRKQLQLNSFIKPITLANFYPMFLEVGTIAGYGHHEIGVNAPREGMVVIASSSPNTGTITTTGMARVGHGDSGGPLIVRGRLAGVISKTCFVPTTEAMCQSSYASVAANLNWIQLVTNFIAYEQPS